MRVFHVVPVLLLGSVGALVSCDSDPSGPGAPRVFEGDLVVSTLEELADFHRAGWTEIAGDLIIGGEPGPGGHSNDLESLEGMETLRVVTGDLRVRATGNLNDVSALAGLEEVGGLLEFWMNAALEEIPAFPDLVAVGHLSIGWHPQLRHLGGFPVLETVGDRISIADNAELEAVPPFALVREIPGHLHIHGNRRLESLGGFPTLEEVGGGVFLSRNDALVELEAFPALERVGEGLLISGNPALTQIEGFPELAVVEGGLGLSTNLALPTLPAFPRLESVGDNVHLMGNESLEEVVGFPALTSVGGDFTVGDNGPLEALPVFPALAWIGGTLRFGAIAREGFQVEGFPVLEEIGGSVAITENIDIGHIAPFTALRTVGEHLEIRFNGGIADLDWLPEVTSAVRDVLIVENSALADIAALGTLGTAPRIIGPAVLGNFSVVANPLLPRAQAEDLAEALGVAGTVTITGGWE